jgi:glycosyltransferase involved in cell wall biosynthesis
MGTTRVEVSVVICTYNRAKSLRGALASLAAMPAPSELTWEVVVVDNNSKDDTTGATAEFQRSSGLNVRYVFEARQGLNYARNAGVKAARGDLIFFIDDDVRVSGSWLLEMKRAFDLNPVVGVGGRVLIKEDLQRPEWWNVEYDGALGKFDNGSKDILSDETYNSIVGIGANIGFKRSVFDQYGYFQPHLDRRGRRLLMGGDIEYTQRIKAAGGLLMYRSSAVVYHNPDVVRITKSYLRRWYFRIGEWEARKVPAGSRTEYTVFTMPRWKYRSMLEHFVRTFSLFLQRRFHDGFYYELQCISLVGYFFGAVKNSVSSMSLVGKKLIECAL